MALKFNCPECGREIIVKFLKAGEVAKCPGCGAEISVPAEAIEIKEVSKMSTKTESENTLSSPAEVTTTTDDKKIFISPAGALFALICFFLPWTKFSCDHTVVIKSGAQLGEEFWIVFVAALVIIVAFYIFKHQGQLAKSKLVVIVSSIIAIVITILKYASLVGKLQNEWHMTPEQIGLSIEFGAFGTILGFIVALIDVPFLKSEVFPKAEIQKTTGNYCPNCGAKVTAEDTYCPSCGAKII